MITSEYELQEKLEELRRDTLPMIWKSCPQVNGREPIETLHQTLLFIKLSKNPKLITQAEALLRELIDFDVDCDPTVTVSL